MWDVKACRGCLVTDCRLEKISDTYRRIIPSLTGLDIAEGDGYPQYLCMECHTQVKRALAFRRRCRRANFVLKQIMIAKKQVTYNDISTVNRKKNNLTTSLITTTVSIDEIVPENSSEIQEKEESKFIEENKVEKENEEEIEVELDREEIVADDNEDDLPNIDLDDVFKDLKEENVDEESEESEVEEVKIEAPKKKEKPKTQGSEINRLTICKALSNTILKYVPEEQQISNFNARMGADSFKSACFKCSLCLTVYDQFASLVAHTKVHKSIKNGHCCNVCKRNFELEEELIYHKSYYHWYEYNCGLCNGTHYSIEEQINCYNVKKKPEKLVKAESYMSSLVVTPLAQEAMPRTLQNWSVPKYKCNICNFGFLHKSYFDKHRKEHLATNHKYKCATCGTYHPGSRHMKRHNDWYHSYSYTCKRCKQVFMNRFLAKDHVLKDCKDKPEIKTKSLCTYCGKTFVGHKLSLHIYYVHHGEAYTHHCIICGLSFKSQTKLFHHQVNRHHHIRVGDIRLGDARHSCLHCNVRFVSSTALEVHIGKSGHSAANTVEQTCALCKVTFSSEDDLALHAATCRLTKYPQKCIYCDKMQSGAAEYQNHYRKKHVGQGSYAGSFLYLKDYCLCYLCGRTMHKTSLRKHIQQHSAPQEMPYSCNLCLSKKVQFATALPYAIHMIANHTARPYHCARCPARFKNRCECRVHILKTHAPVRPYACGACARTFSHADYLNEHSVRAHGVDAKKTYKNIFLSKNMIGKIFVYPDMKLDVSLIGKEITDLIDVYICDYMDENERILQDHSEYLIYEQSDEPDTRNVRQKRVKSTDNGPKKKRKRRRKDLGDNIDVKQESIEVNSEENVLTDSKENVKEEVSMNMSKVGNMVSDDHGNNYEVILDENGDEFVEIDGVLYKLES